MDLLQNDAKSADIRISTDDLITIHQSMNEVCNGIDLFEFQTRIGVTREEVVNLMKIIDQIIEKIEQAAQEN